MATISSAGVGSGLDVSGLVEKLVAAEGEPVQIRLDRKEAKLQASLSAMGTFKGVVSEFQSSVEALRNPDTFESIDLTSSDEELLTATATKEAQPGEYDIDITQLARAHKLASTVFESDRLPIGTGSLSIQLGRFDQDSNQFVMNPDNPANNITITKENSSLRGIQDSINKSGAGIRASVINDGNGFRLILSSRIAGIENSIRIKVSDEDGQDSDLSGLSALSYLPEGSKESINTEGVAVIESTGINLEEIVSPQDAKVNIDGLEIINSGNEISSVVDGLTLNLQPGSEGSSVRLKVAVSKSGISESVTNFVTKYNDMLTTATSLTGYDSETKTAGPLSGDSSIRGIVSQTRRTLGDNFSLVNPTYDSLSSIGIVTQPDGTLNLDESKFKDAIDNNFQQVAQLFAITGSATDPAVRYMEAGKDTPTGAFDLNVTRIAKQGAYQTKPLAQLPVVVSEGSNRFKLNVDGINSNEIKLSPNSYTDINVLATELQNQINTDENFQKNNVSTEVQASNGRLFIVSNRFGSASYVEVVQADSGLNLELGLQVKKGIHGEDIAGTLNGAAATGSGHVLTGKGVGEGLQIEVLEGDTGDRGKVFFSHGIGARLHDLTNNFLSSDGLIGLRSEGYSNRIEDINKEREKLARKLEVSEQRYLKQFTSLDATLGKMRSTGDYLSSQLSSLPGAAKPRN